MYDSLLNFMQSKLSTYQQYTLLSPVHEDAQMKQQLSVFVAYISVAPI